MAPKLLQQKNKWLIAEWLWPLHLVQISNILMLHEVPKE
jgi:hypothetical protein